MIGKSASVIMGRRTEQPKPYDPDASYIEVNAREIVLYRKDGSLVVWPALKETDLSTVKRS